jgi:hypothetical protein
VKDVAGIADVPAGNSQLKRKMQVFFRGETILIKLAFSEGRQAPSVEASDLPFLSKVEVN